MGVASKTKTKRYTIAVLGVLVALSALPTWANTSPEIKITAIPSSVVSTHWNEDLSVLRTKLKERFSWISQEVVSLVTNTVTPAKLHGSADVRVIDVSQWMLANPVKIGQDFFVDVENDPYKVYIHRLASYGVLNTSQKFYPQNYFRVDDFAGLLAKVYQKKYNKTLDTNQIEWLTAHGEIMTKWMFQQAMKALWMEVQFSIDGNPYDKLIRSEWAYYLVRVFDLPALSVASSKALILPSYFVDTVNHPFVYAITTLASLDIISAQSPTFYPDNYLRHYDFVLIFVNAFLNHTHASLPEIAFSSFADVSSTAPYFLQLAYAADHWMIDDIVSSRKGQLYFDPDTFITKDQVYTILHKALNVDFIYDKQQARQEKITRAEIAQVIVDSFWFEPKIISSESSLTNELDTDTLLTKLRVLLSIL